MEKIKFKDAPIGTKFKRKLNSNDVFMKSETVYMVITKENKKFLFHRNAVIIERNEKGYLGSFSDDCLITPMKIEDLQKEKKECEHYSKSKIHTSYRFCSTCGEEHNLFDKNKLETDKTGKYKDCNYIHKFRIENFIEYLEQEPYCEYCGKKIISISNE